MVVKSTLDPSEGIAVFTDGSTYAKDRTGGWAWVALDAFNGLASDAAGRRDTTISQMELQAPTEALIWLAVKYGSLKVLIFSDSEYVVKGFMDKSRKRRRNVDFWDRLEAAAGHHILVEFEHVKGHAGQEWNELADDLAGKARKSL